MALTDAERRRYFRIEDTMKLSYEILSKEDAEDREKEISRTDYTSPNRMHLVERQLQLAIDKLRIQSPEVAEAIELLNMKFGNLKDSVSEELVGGRGAQLLKVSISACGISFPSPGPIDIKDLLDIDLTLSPTDLHIFTLGEVVNCTQNTDGDDWTISVDFYGMTTDDEELLVQHIVKRQGKLLAASRGTH